MTGITFHFEPSLNSIIHASLDSTTSSSSSRTVNFLVHKTARNFGPHGLGKELIPTMHEQHERSRLAHTLSDGGNAVSYWPMSDGHLDSPQLQQKISRLQARRSPTVARVHKGGGRVAAAAAATLQDTRKPLGTLTNTSTPSASHSRVLVWRSKVGGVLMDVTPAHPDSPSLQRRPPAVYSYRIANQRLSHVAAFAPPRSQAYPAGSGATAALPVGNPRHQHIAYRFVFTNTL